MLKATIRLILSIIICATTHVWALTDSEYKMQYPNFQKDLDEATAMLETTVKSVGADHIDAGRASMKIGLTYARMGLYLTAEPHYKSALEIFEKTLDKNDPECAKLLENIADMYNRGKDHARAEMLYKRALFIHEVAYGPAPQESYFILNKLGMMYVQDGKYGQAESQFKKCLENVDKNQDREKNIRLHSVLTQLAQLLRNQEKYWQAEPYLLRRMDIHITDIQNYYNIYELACNNFDQKMYSKAEPYFDKAISLIDQKLGPNAYSEGLMQAAKNSLKLGKFDKAEGYLNRAKLNFINTIQHESSSIYLQNKVLECLIQVYAKAGNTAGQKNCEEQIKINNQKLRSQPRAQPAPTVPPVPAAPTAPPATAAPKKDKPASTRL